jgi:hypothetical protein
VNEQHGFQRIGSAAHARLRIVRLNQLDQPRPGYDLIHLGQESLPARLLAFAGVFEIGKAHLAHRVCRV